MNLRQYHLFEHFHEYTHNQNLFYQPWKLFSRKPYESYHMGHENHILIWQPEFLLGSSGLLVEVIQSLYTEII